MCVFLSQQQKQNSDIAHDALNFTSQYLQDQRPQLVIRNQTGSAAYSPSEESMKEKNKKLDDYRRYLDAASKFFDERDKEREERKNKSDQVIEHNIRLNEERQMRQTDDDQEIARDPLGALWKKRCIAVVPRDLQTTTINSKIKKILGMQYRYTEISIPHTLGIIDCLIYHLLRPSLYACSLCFF